MSISVAVPDLPATIAGYRWAYLVTVRDDGRAQIVAITPAWDGDALTAAVGRGTASNVEARPSVSLCYPPVDVDGMSLIVDGDGSVVDDRLRFVPTAAVLHRPAPPAG